MENNKKRIFKTRNGKEFEVLQEHIAQNDDICGKNCIILFKKNESQEKITRVLIKYHSTFLKERETSDENLVSYALEQIIDDIDMPGSVDFDTIEDDEGYYHILECFNRDLDDE